MIIHAGPKFSLINSTNRASSIDESKLQNVKKCCPNQSRLDYTKSHPSSYMDPQKHNFPSFIGMLKIDVTYMIYLVSTISVTKGQLSF